MSGKAGKLANVRDFEQGNVRDSTKSRISVTEKKFCHGKVFVQKLFVPPYC